jgi:hypothetical protein
MFSRMTSEDMLARPAARLEVVLQNAARILFLGHALRLRLIVQDRFQFFRDVMASILSLSLYY